MEKEYSIEELKEFNKDVIEFNRTHDDIEALGDCDPITKEKLDIIADKLINEAKVHDDLVTGFMKDIFNHDCYMVELENRFKGKKRLKEKIYQRMITTGKNMDNIASYISDLMRFTVILDYDNYVSLLDEFLNKINNDTDFIIYNIKNRWDNWCCKDISCKFKTSDGFVFEVQFHTEQSYIVKERLTRQSYKARRRNDCPNDILEKATILTKYHMDSIIVPVGAKEYNFGGGKHV